MATHSSILTPRIPWTEEPSRLQSIVLQRVGHNRSDLACIHAPKKKNILRHTALNLEYRKLLICILDDLLDIKSKLKMTKLDESVTVSFRLQSNSLRK